MKYLIVLMLTGCSLNFEVQMSTGEGGMQEVAETEQTTTADIKSGL